MISPPDPDLEQLTDQKRPGSLLNQEIPQSHDSDTEDAKVSQQPKEKGKPLTRQSSFQDLLDARLKLKQDKPRHRTTSSKERRRQIARLVSRWHWHV